MTKIECIKAEITATLDLLVAALSPVKIYWLPWISGSDRPAKYIDLLIVVPGGQTHDEAKQRLDWLLCSQPVISCTLINEGVVIEGLRKADLFCCNNCVAENLLYDNGGKTYPVPDLMDVAKARLRTMNDFLISYGRAKEMYQLATLPVSADAGEAVSLKRTLTPFLIHQSIELCLRAVLQALNGRAEKTHEIRVQARHVRKCAPELYALFDENDEPLVKQIHWLDQSYAKSRYDTTFTFPVEYIGILTDIARQLLDKSKRSVCVRLMSAYRTDMG